MHLLATLVFAVSASAQYDYPKSQAVFIQSTTLANCMLLVADQYPAAKVKPDPATYLKSFRGRDCEIREQPDNEWIKYLAAQAARKCDFATGHEEALKKWILAQPDNSVDPLSIFARAMQLNDGNLLNSLITVHQLLRNSARWFSKSLYDYDSSTGESRAFWNKFVDIRGDLTERGPGFDGDHAGSWYRLWSMALWRTRRGYTPLVRWGSCGSMRSPSMPERFLSDLEAYVLAISAEAIKPGMVVFGSKYKPQLKDLGGKAKMNTLGADLGSTFGAYLAGGLLDLEPSFRKRTFEKICKDRQYLTTGK